MSAVQEWFDDDSFWADLYPHLFGEEKESSASAQVRAALKLSGVSSGKCLDLCCGSGRHLIPLAREGFTVTGVDLNEGQLKRCRQRGESEGVNCELVQEDMRTFHRSESFDLVISMFNSLGYFDAEFEDIAVLNHIRQNLRIGGACFLELISKEYLARTWSPEVKREELSDSVLERRVEILDGWHRIRNIWRLEREGEVRDFSFEQSVYSGRELFLMMREAGFEQVSLYGGFDGRPYNNSCQCLIAVGRV